MSYLQQFQRELRISVKRSDGKLEGCASLNGRVFMIKRASEPWKPATSFIGDWWEHISKPRWLCWLMISGIVCTFILMFTDRPTPPWILLLYATSILGTFGNVARQRRRWMKFFSGRQANE